MAIYVLVYEVVEGYAEKRVPFRPAHFANGEAAMARGELLLGGAAGEPIDSALLVFDVDDPTVVEQFAQNDPYVQEGLVTRWSVKPWNVVLGQSRLE